MSIRLPLRSPVTREDRVCECSCLTCGGCTNQASPSLMFMRGQRAKLLRSLRRPQGDG